MESAGFTRQCPPPCSLLTLHPSKGSLKTPMNASPPSQSEESSLPIAYLKAKMKRSPVFPRDENVCGDELGYDPLHDFPKFLEEARKHASEAKLEPASSPYFPVKEQFEGEGRKSKKSWKKSLFFWWKFERRAPAQSILAIGAIYRRVTLVSKPRRGTALSGPIAGGRSKHHTCRHGRPASGPLSGCFTPSRVDDGEAEMPYMWLEEINNPSGNHAFGPIYLVT